MAAEDTLGLIGTTVADKYVVEACVGEGGFAVVYRAQHKLWQKPVALKCFKTMMDASPAMRERLLKDFVQEGALLTELSARSASIVQARDIGTLTTPAGAWIPYMVLEWLDGSTLDALIGEGPSRRAWSFDLTLAILEPIAEALEIAHRKNITHRDVKPANVFVVGALPRPTDTSPNPEMHVKLLDFGIAKVVQSAAEQGVTQTSGAITSFTPAYGAPEQFSRARGATGPWTDVYALALIFGEMLSGRAPLEGDDFIQLGMATADPSRRPTPRTLGVDVPDAIEAVCARALSVAPTERYATAGEFWNALRTAAGHAPRRTMMLEGGAVPSRPSAHALARTEVSPTTDPRLEGRTAPAVTQEPVSAAPKSKAPLAIGAVLVLGALGAGGFFLFGKKAEPKVDPGTPAAAKSSAPAASSSAAPAKPKCGPGMAEIPATAYFMGSDTGEDEEKPAHKVRLSGFCMDVTEVTVEDYLACSDKGECKRPWAVVDWPDIKDGEKKLYTPLCNVNDPTGKAKHPINCVDWQMAVSYCEYRGKRLPTSAEWELAARGPDGRTYPWGDEAPDETRLNACGKECVAWGKTKALPLVAMYAGDDHFPHTAPVGTFPKGASKFGVLDVVGNVWEWTADWDGKYTADEQADPKGPASGSERVVRGGAWNGSYASWLRPSARYSFPPETKSHVVGIRCASTLGAAPKAAGSQAAGSPAAGSQAPKP